MSCVYHLVCQHPCHVLCVPSPWINMVAIQYKVGRIKYNMTAYEEEIKTQTKCGSIPWKTISISHNPEFQLRWDLWPQVHYNPGLFSMVRACYLIYQTHRYQDPHGFCDCIFKNPHGKLQTHWLRGWQVRKRYLDSLARNPQDKESHTRIAYYVRNALCYVGFCILV